MISTEIVKGVHYVGVNDRTTTRFEGIWPLPYGVSYNSYLVCGAQKNAVIDGVEVSHCFKQIDRIKEIKQDIKIDYLIINHMEPDHSGGVVALCREFPEIKVVGNAKTADMLKGYYGLEKNVVVVADGDCIDLGGKKLKVQAIGANTDHSTITITNGTLELSGTNGIEMNSNSELTLDGVTMTASSSNGIVCGFQGTDEQKSSSKNNSLIIRNSTINMTGSQSVGILIQNNGHTVTIENSTINHKYFGITQNGVIPGSTIKLVNTNISGTYSGIYLSNKADGEKNTLIVEGGKIHSEQESAIEVKKTDITVKNATLSSDAEKQSYSVNGGGSSGVGYGIVLAGYANGTAYEGETTFENLTFNLAAGADAIGILKYNGSAGEEVELKLK